MMFASSAVYRNDSFTKLVGSDFFNTLSHKRKFVVLTRRRFVIANSRPISDRVDRQMFSLDC